MAGVSAVLSFLRQYWLLIVAALSAVGLAIGWARFRLSPLQALEERAHKQSEYRRLEEHEKFKSRMIEQHLELGDSFLDSRLHEAAEQEFQRALDLDPTNIKAEFGLLKADVFKPISAYTREPMVAERRLKFILKENPEDKHALLHFGILYTFIDSEKARSYLHRALAQDPKLSPAYIALGFLDDISGHPDQATEMYEKALQLAEWDPLALNNVSYGYIRQGRFKEAIQQLALLLSLDEQTVIAYWNLSNAHRYLGEHEAAYLLLRQLRQMMEDEEMLVSERNQATWFFETAADESGAGVLFVTPEQKKAYSLLSLALSCHLTGRAQETRETLRQVTGLACDDPQPGVEFLRANMRRLVHLDGGLTDEIRSFEKMLADARGGEDKAELSAVSEETPRPDRQTLRLEKAALIDRMKRSGLHL